MGQKSDNQVKETPQQAAMVDLAMKQVADYETRWLPLQKNLAEGVAEMGAKGSTARVQAQGMAANETEAKFSKARTGLETRLASTGGLNSGRAKAAITGLSEDQATSTGLGRTQADQQIDDAYTAGLGTVMQLGQGQKGTAIQSMGNIADMSGRRAANDASNALEDRMGNAQLIGNTIGAGFGLIGAPKPSGGPAGGYLTPSNPGGYGGAGMSGGYVMPKVGGG